MTEDSKLSTNISKLILLKYLLIIIVISFVIIITLDVPNLYVLSKRGIQIEAKITGFDPQENQTSYEYSLNGKVYQGKFTYHQGSNSSYPQIGDKWKISVDPEMPQRHSLGDATLNLRDSIKGFLFIIVFLIIGCFARILFISDANPFKKSDMEAKEKWEEYKNSLNK